MKKIFMAICISLLLAACSDPKNVTISSAEDLQKNAEILQKLTDEEKKLLAGFILRKEMGKIFGESGGIAPNTKVGDAIEEQRKFEVERKKQEEEQKIAQQKAQAEKQGKIDAINNSVQVQFISKQTNLNNPKYTFDDKLQLDFKVVNKSQKIISGLKGNAYFYDKFGDQIMVTELKMDFNDIGGRLKSTEEYDYIVEILLGVFNGGDKVSEVPIEDIKYQFIPDTVLFEDGEKLTLN